jgi:hypothetical protein
MQFPRSIALVASLHFVARAVAADTIPHAYHSGQHFHVNDFWVERAYGLDLEEFQDKRDELLGEVGRKMFASELMEQLGIHVPV